MRKSSLAQAVSAAMVLIGSAAAYAQSSLTIYGMADVSVDHTRRSASSALSPTIAALTASTNPTAVQQVGGLLNTLSAQNGATRVSPSNSAQTAYGFKGVEDLGAGYKAGFVLEGQVNHDNGSLGNDGRVFGRQTYVGLTTPYGEVRLGRQYAPVFYSVALVTSERLGSLDLFTEGGATNNLQVRQDNQIAYWLKYGAWMGEVAYSPNAGTYDAISVMRASSGHTITTTGGQMLGGATAGAETTGDRGRSVGLFTAYMEGPWVATFGYHQNQFGNAASPVLTVLSMVNGGGAITFDDYHVYSLAAKYTLPGHGAELSAAYGDGRYNLNGTTHDPRLQSVALGVRVPVGKLAYIGQVSQVRFANYTKGKDTGIMLGAEYELSKRTVLYSRVGQIKDSAGTAVNGLSGGPDFIGVLLGYRETPVFAGNGITAGGRASTVAAGIRHTF